MAEKVASRRVHSVHRFLRLKERRYVSLNRSHVMYRSRVTHTANEEMPSSIEMYETKANENKERERENIDGRRGEEKK